MKEYFFDTTCQLEENGTYSCSSTESKVSSFTNNYFYTIRFAKITLVYKLIKYFFQARITRHPFLLALGRFIGIVVNLIARAAGRMAAYAGQIVRSAASNVGRLIPTLQRTVPRFFAYRRLPQLTFDGAQRVRAGSLISTVFSKAQKGIVVIGGYSGFGYMVKEIADACQTKEPKISDDEMADIITSKVFAKMAEKELMDKMNQDEKNRQEFVDEQRKKIEEESVREEAEYQAQRLKEKEERIIARKARANKLLMEIKEQAERTKLIEQEEKEEAEYQDKQVKEKEERAIARKERAEKDADEKSFARIIQIGNLTNSDSSEQSSLNGGSIAMIVAGVLVSISVAIYIIKEGCIFCNYRIIA